MEGIASVCSYQQHIEELKNTLFRTSLELESAQMAAQEERRRNEENVKQLLHHLRLAFQERDEAKDQLKMLLNNIAQLAHALPSLPSESAAPVMPSKGSSSVAESDSLSETHKSRSLSPVDSSLFDAAASPELSNMNTAISSSMVAPNQPFLHEFPVSSSFMIPAAMAAFDRASAVIDRLATRKPLPEKGKLLQAVMEAGPMLQTLLVAGPLPEWRNPPPLESLQIPPISINDCADSTAFVHKPTASVASRSQAASLSYLHVSNSAPQPCSASVLNFSREASSCLMKRPAMSSCFDDGLANDPTLIWKRQKFQC